MAGFEDALQPARRAHREPGHRGRRRWWSTGRQQLRDRWSAAKRRADRIQPARCHRRRDRASAPRVTNGTPSASTARCQRKRNGRDDEPGRDAAGPPGGPHRSRHGHNARCRAPAPPMPSNSRQQKTRTPAEHVPRPGYYKRIGTDRRSRSKTCRSGSSRRDRIPPADADMISSEPPQMARREVAAEPPGRRHAEATEAQRGGSILDRRIETAQRCSDRQVEKGIVGKNRNEYRRLQSPRIPGTRLTQA